MVVLSLVGMFLCGCSFEAALYGERLLGIVPPAVSAVLAVVGAAGWAGLVLAGTSP